MAYRKRITAESRQANMPPPEIMNMQESERDQLLSRLQGGTAQIANLFLQQGGMKGMDVPKPIVPEDTPMDIFQKEYMKEQAKRLADPQDPTQSITVFNKDTGDFETKEVPAGRVLTTQTPDLGMDTTGLSTEQQIQGRSLARKQYGVRGMDKGLQPIYKLMQEGKNIDEIEDMLRFSGQSAEMTGVMRRASQNVVMGSSPEKQQVTMDMLDDAISTGDPDIIKETFKRSVLSQVPTDQKNQIVGSERTLEFLDEIQNDLDVLESSGIDTNIFTGKLEDVYRKVGNVKNPELARIATKIAAAIQKYRRSMSGVAFSVPESREYAQMFPSIEKTGALNTANINGLRETLSGDLSNIYGLYMGKGAYKEIFKNDENKKSYSDDDAMVNALLDQLEGQGGY